MKLKYIILPFCLLIPLTVQFSCSMNPNATPFYPTQNVSEQNFVMIFIPVMCRPMNIPRQPQIQMNNQAHIREPETVDDILCAIIGDRNIREDDLDLKKEILTLLSEELIMRAGSKGNIGEIGSLLTKEYKNQLDKIKELMFWSSIEDKLLMITESSKIKEESFEDALEKLITGATSGGDFLNNLAYLIGKNTALDKKITYLTKSIPKDKIRIKEEFCKRISQNVLLGGKTFILEEKENEFILEIFSENLQIYSAIPQICDIVHGLFL